LTFGSINSAHNFIFNYSIVIYIERERKAGENKYGEKQSRNDMGSEKKEDGEKFFHVGKKLELVGIGAIAIKGIIKRSASKNHIPCAGTSIEGHAFFCDIGSIYRFHRVHIVL